MKIVIVNQKGPFVCPLRLQVLDIVLYMINSQHAFHIYLSGTCGLLHMKWLKTKFKKTCL